LYPTIFASPAAFGLESFGSIDWSDGGYDFDYIAVWRDLGTGTFYYAEDSGCSCPSPFEDHSRETLIPLTSLGEFQAYLNARNPTGEDDHEYSYRQNRSSEIVALVERLHAAGLR
jgi:hypothetical protein